MLIDSHCHLNHLKKINTHEAVAAARDAGVTHMLSICVEKKDVPDLKTIVSEHQNVKATLGIHPCDVHTHSQKDFDDMIGLLTQKPEQFIGLGETGLDYYYSKEHALMQGDFFAQHIDQAKKHDCPVIVHTRDAEEDTVGILKAHNHNKVIIHCFTGTLEMAKQCLDLGAYISFSGIITFNKADALREVVKYVPIDRLLVETDSPYLAPVPHRGHENQPAYVKHVAEAVATIKGLSLDEVMSQTSTNFIDLFGWPHA
jgi:TatD DNase family protein